MIQIHKGLRMYAIDRRRAIAALLRPSRITTIEELASHLAVSRTTIHRDLMELHNAGHLMRVKGGAVPRRLAQAAPDPERHPPINLAARRAIAQVALGFIEPHDRIILAGGATVALMAEQMGDRPCQVLTASIPVLLNLFDKPQVRVRLAGGEVFREQQVMLTPYETDGRTGLPPAAADAPPISTRFGARTLFLGCQALSRKGVMQTDPLRVQSDRRLVAQAETVILLAESAKIDRSGVLAVCPLCDIDVVITDDQVSDQAVAWLNAEAIRVIRAPLASGPEPIGPRP